MQKELKTILDLVPVLRQLADTLESLSETLTEQEVQTFEPVYPPEEPTPVPPAKEPPAVSMDAVRAVLAEKSRSGFTDAVRALLQRHGASMPPYFIFFFRCLCLISFASCCSIIVFSHVLAPGLPAPGQRLR